MTSKYFLPLINLSIFFLQKAKDLDPNDPLPCFLLGMWWVGCTEQVCLSVCLSACLSVLLSVCQSYSVTVNMNSQTRKSVNVVHIIVNYPFYITFSYQKATEVTGMDVRDI